MTTRTHLLPVAAVLGLIGGSLGVIAGVVQATAGAHIPEWTGHKADPLALGIVTALFSGLSVFSAARLRATRSPSPACRVAVSVGMLVSGGLCFSTVGALWYLPGTLLLGATALVLTSGYGRETRQVVADNWLRGLLSALGGFELLMAVSVGEPAIVAVGVLGGLTLLVAPWTPGVGLPVILLLIGTLPFAALTWWGLVSPLLAVLALVLGLVILGRPGRHLSPKTLTT
ncbi:MAG: iron complex transport system permease protein [Actinomycetota bacterium]|nr:iron complex transport system permease protein [Actinomycetota bacterium]